MPIVNRFFTGQGVGGWVWWGRERILDWRFWISDWGKGMAINMKRSTCNIQAYFARTQIRRLAGREPYNMEAERRDTYTTGIVPYNSEAKLPRPGSGASNMPFYQTNPPFFDGFFYGNGYEYVAYSGNLREKSVGSFSETNPPGGVFSRSVAAKTRTCTDGYGRCGRDGRTWTKQCTAEVRGQSTPTESRSRNRGCRGMTARRGYNAGWVANR